MLTGDFDRWRTSWSPRRERNQNQSGNGNDGGVRRTRDNRLALKQRGLRERFRELGPTGATRDGKRCVSTTRTVLSTVFVDDAKKTFQTVWVRVFLTSYNCTYLGLETQERGNRWRTGVHDDSLTTRARAEYGSRSIMRETDTGRWISGGKHDQTTY